MTPVTVDLACVSDCDTDHALEYLHKALTDPGTSSIWLPHDDAWIREPIEAFTAAGLQRLDTIRARFFDALQDAGTVAKAFRPDPEEVAIAIAALEGRRPADYTVGDWLTLIDWLVLQYLPDSFALEEAEYLAARAMLAGKIQSAGPMRPPSDVETLIPDSRTGILQRLKLTPLESALLDVATYRVATAVTSIGDATRNRMRRLVTDHLEQRIVGNPQATVAKLEQRLFDEFSVLNRDWRRIAITEVGNATNEGFIANCAPGQRVRRIEVYADACPFCKKIHGMVFTVVHPAKEDKDGWKEVWVGKNNISRSASPRKRVGDELVEREPEELWWPAAGLQHPHCRGRWVLETSAPADPRVRADVTKILAGIGIKPAWASAAAS